MWARGQGAVPAERGAGGRGGGFRGKRQRGGDVEPDPGAAREDAPKFPEAIFWGLWIAKGLPKQSLDRAAETPYLHTHGAASGKRLPADRSIGTFGETAKRPCWGIV